MTAIVIDKSDCQLISINKACDTALTRLYGSEILSDISEQDYQEWVENAKNPQENTNTRIDERWAARADIEQLLTKAFLAGNLVARAYTIDDAGNEKRCLLPKEFWDISPDSSFSMTAFSAFYHGIVDDSTRIKTILGFSKIIGWSVGADEKAFLAWLDGIAAKRFVVNSGDIKSIKHLPVKKLGEWNINQTICWIIFRDETLLIKYADGGSSLTHLGIRQVLSAADDSPEKPYMTFPSAIEALIQRCELSRLVAVGYKNDIGESIPMTEKDWRNTNIYDEGNKTYVASKDHIFSIGRPKWFGVTFRSEDIMWEWPADTIDSKPDAAEYSPHYPDPNMDADEAIMWIAHRERGLKSPAYFARIAVTDIFWSSPFIKGHFDIDKRGMLAFSGLIANGGEWTDESWSKRNDDDKRGFRHSKDVMMKDYKSFSEKYRLSPIAFATKLSASIAAENDFLKNLEQAKRGLLNAAKNEDIEIWGRGRDKKMGKIPKEHLMDKNIGIDIAHNALMNDAPINHGFIEWQELQINRAHILDLWKEKTEKSPASELHENSLNSDAVQTDTEGALSVTHQYTGGIMAFDSERNQETKKRMMMESKAASARNDAVDKVQKPLQIRKKKQAQFKGKPGPKTKYPNDAYIKMRVLINSGDVTSIREAAKKIAPDYNSHSEESAAARLAQTYSKRIQEIA